MPDDTTPTTIPNDDRPVLQRAFDIAFPIMEADIDTPDIVGVLTAEGADPLRVLAHAFLSVMSRLAQLGKVTPTLFSCGWCQAAAGGGDEAWRSLPRLDDAAIKAHTLVCEHNPLAAAIRVAISAADKCRHWNGPTGALSDALERLRALVAPGAPVADAAAHAKVQL